MLAVIRIDVWCCQRADSRETLPLLIAFVVIPGDASQWGMWAIITLCVGSLYIHAIFVAITSRNAGSVRTRNVASAMYNIMVQASNVMSSQIYRMNDAPLHRTCNKALKGFTVYNIFLFAFVKWFYVSVNS